MPTLPTPPGRQSQHRHEPGDDRQNDRYADHSTLSSTQLAALEVVEAYTQQTGDELELGVILAIRMRSRMLHGHCAGNNLLARAGSVSARQCPL